MKADLLKKYGASKTKKGKKSKRAKQIGDLQFGGLIESDENDGDGEGPLVVNADEFSGVIVTGDTVIDPQAAKKKVPAARKNSKKRGRTSKDDVVSSSSSDSDDPPRRRQLSNSNSSSSSTSSSDSDSDGPPRRLSKMASGHEAGLQSGKTFKTNEEKIKGSKKEKMSKAQLKKAKFEQQGSTTFRDKEGKKVDMIDVIIRKQEEEETNKKLEKSAELDLAKGAQQKRQDEVSERSERTSLGRREYSR